MAGGITTPEITDYLRSHALCEPKILAELRLETVKRQRGFLLLPETGQALAFLYRLIGAQRILDVGCFTGYSALTAALAAGRSAQVISFDINLEWTKLAREFWEKAGVQNQIELKIGPALESLDALISSGQSEAFDAALIDADKANYANYIDRCYKLIQKGGLIILDNVLWKGSVADEASTDTTAVLFRELTSRLMNDERFDFTLLTVGDGLTLLRKR